MSQSPASLTVIILTRDEARHIVRAIESVRGVATRVLVVDSGSVDATQDLARAAGADVLEHPFVNHAAQFNWALDNGRIATDWVLRLDADEVVLDAPAMAAFIAGNPAAVAATINRRIHFLGRWIRHGGIYPTRILRLWRHGCGRIESRWMDEHVVVTGAVTHLDTDIADINLNNVGWWTAKHNHYAALEAVQQLSAPKSDSAAQTGDSGPQAGRKRWLKDNVYARLPLGLRPLLYFLYRYVLRLGFLDGWQGLAFHGLQGGWYRFLVDVKIAEIRALMASRDQTLAQIVAEEYRITLD